MWQDSTNNYGAPSSSQNTYYAQQPPTQPLQFYSPGTSAADPNSFYPGSRPSLDGNVGAQGSIAQPGGPNFGGNIQTQGGWWTAFGTGGFEGEPPLLEGAQRLDLDNLTACSSRDYRTRHQLLAYSRQINDCPQPTKPCRRAHHGRC